MSLVGVTDLTAKLLNKTFKPKKESTDMNLNLHELEAGDQKDHHPTPQHPVLRAGGAKKINYKSYLENYAPYIYIWVCRVFVLVQAYYYHSFPALILLTWLLFSFMINLASYVSFTIAVFTPIYTITFIYLYFINIPGLFIA